MDTPLIRSNLAEKGVFEGFHIPFMEMAESLSSKGMGSMEVQIGALYCLLYITIYHLSLTCRFPYSPIPLRPFLISFYTLHFSFFIPSFPSSVH